jgi:tetratricopeptide (TPR) repeat protein
MKTQKHPNNDRQIRVFISSTFRDMQAERDYLVKFIFPQLRKLCESRGVTWGEVDLRWGVTDEQAYEGKVLPICLEEIKRCRPYFIGLLGERYGWIPDAIPADVIEREPWLKEHLHGKKSVTELEILHGVLREEKMHGHAFFYFRDPAFINTVQPDKRLDFVTEDAARAEKLRLLKEKIRHAQVEQVCVLRENYPTPEALGELILTDLTKVINETWPEGSQPAPLDREAMDHEAYAKSRERVYIGRQEYFDRLDTHAAANDTQPLVILGESGSGKSALLANWVARYQQVHPDALVIQHYIGATPRSADWATMLRRLMGEFKRSRGIQQDIPDQPDALRSAFPNWLYMAAAKGRIVLVFDALNQLEDRDGAPDLVWLPPVLPENVRLIVSTLPGRPLDEIQKRHWPTLKVELLSADERRRIIAEYLAQHAKSLSAARVDRIAAALPSANPLYLRVLLDELRLVRTYEELEDRIGDYLKAKSPYALYEKVITRWEQDYGADSDLVGDTLSLLWAARRGLTETELLQALGKDGEPLPRAKWSPLSLAMSDALISRGGLLTFAHDFLRTAVEYAYLSTEQDQQRAHLRLADYFERQLAGPRRTEELPWQLAEAKEWQRLHDLLADRAFVRAAWVQDSFDVRIWWRRVETGSHLRMVMTYGKMIEHPESEPDKGYLQLLVSLLENTSHLAEAFRVCQHLAKHYQNNVEWDKFPTMIGGLANILRLQGELERAMELHKESERISRRAGNLRILVSALLGQSLILWDRGDWDGAMMTLNKHESICRLSNNAEALTTARGVQALIFRDRGDLNRAMALHKEEEQMARQSGDLDTLCVSLNNQAIILGARGDRDGAMAMIEEQERICSQLGNAHGLARSLANRGGMLCARGELNKAMALEKEAEHICRKLNYLILLQFTLRSQALILKAWGDVHEAEVLLQEAERICRQLDNLDGLQAVLGDKALLLLERGEMIRAKKLLQEQEGICRRLGHVNGLATALAYQALILSEQGQPTESLSLIEEAHCLAAAHDDEALTRRIWQVMSTLRERNRGRSVKRG